MPNKRIIIITTNVSNNPQLASFELYLYILHRKTRENIAFNRPVTTVFAKTLKIVVMPIPLLTICPVSYSP